MQVWLLNNKFFYLDGISICPPHIAVCGESIFPFEHNKRIILRSINVWPLCSFCSAVFFHHGGEKVLLWLRSKSWLFVKKIGSFCVFQLLLLVKLPLCSWRNCVRSATTARVIFCPFINNDSLGALEMLQLFTPLTSWSLVWSWMSLDQSKMYHFFSF